ncbi:hypothetical protein MMC18_000492 [Xylographa bjoerkii]|nr:hypothetical protein [Xylographa bjoerkii]
MFKADLQVLAEKLDPHAGWKKAASLMLWPLIEKDINDLLSRIVRLKGLVNVALQQDGFTLMLAIRDQNTEIGSSIASMNNELGELKQDTYLQHQFASQPDVRIGYIYLNHQQHDHHTPTTLIGSLLQQLIRSGGHVVSNELIEYYESHSDAGRRPRLSEIFHILQAEVRRLDVFFVILDALDEGEETTRSILLAHLVRLQPKIRLIVTSRQEPIPVYELQSVVHPRSQHRPTVVLRRSPERTTNGPPHRGRPDVGGTYCRNDSQQG